MRTLALISRRSCLEVRERFPKYRDNILIVRNLHIICSNRSMTQRQPDERRCPPPDILWSALAFRLVQQEVADMLYTLVVNSQVRTHKLEDVGIVQLGWLPASRNSN